MKFLIYLAPFLVFGFFLFYLILPTLDFPNPPPDSIQSREPADTETVSRRAYFTNMTRDEVINYYRDQFDKPKLNFLKYPSLRLNYLPEEAQTLIRDQTRSTYLEEIVHPFRESIFINGFEPKQAKDEIWYDKQHFRQKIIIRYVTSDLFFRLTIAFLTFIISVLLLRQWIFWFRKLC